MKDSLSSTNFFGHDKSDKVVPSNRYNAFLYPELTPLTPPFDSQSLAQGDGNLTGVKIAVKDNIAVKDWPLTAGSKILEGYISPYDATIIQRLKKARATLVGKTNLDEFAMGSSTENSAFGPTKNPWDTSRVPGGSSGGSAAAVAAGLCDVALGSDTGGSIRQPAAFCGVTGLKPTYGAVSRYGLVALASSLDVIGPLARSAADVEKVFAAICGKDDNDQTTIDYSYKPTEIDFKKLKIGLPKELWELDIDPEVKKLNDEFVAWLKTKGATVTEVTLPATAHALPAYCVILPAEASANLARYDGIRYKKSERQSGQLLETYFDTRANFGAEVKRRILLGTFALSVGHYDDYYQLAVKVAAQIKKEYAEVFQKVDVLVNPTTPTPAFKFGEKAKDPVAMYQSDLLTVSANLAGVPALSLPAGFTGDNLPIGGQLTASWKKDNLLLTIAKEYQKETDWHERKPN
ncbi:MAG TPA: Asp-tRNA(Asn)/Glu-tRNA(Gln) amidotransferase subunit GatA [Candidatus Saccharimonadales bacterium]|nr:Asp-tRNA(Asn)/Glu-tRNA(Gln) amidotransferase subunit GatA [Candidatus Saccharimonadales bacterium]